MAANKHSPTMEHDFQYAEKPHSQEDGIMNITHRERMSDSDLLSEGATVATVSSAYAERGAPINRSLTAELKKESNSALTWSKLRRALRDPFSEFMGV